MNKKLIWIAGGGLLLVGLVVTIISIILSGAPKTSELTFVTFGEDEKNLQKIVAPFEQENNIKVKFIKKDLNNYELDSLNMISTNQIDIWGIPNNWLPKHLDKLSIYNGAPDKPDLTKVPLYQQMYPAVVSAENVIDGKIYGQPLTLDSLVMFGNSKIRTGVLNNQSQKLSAQEQELLSKVATNWADMVSQVKLVTQKNGQKISQSGLAMGTADLAPATDILTMLMLQYGVQMTNDENTQATFHTAINKFNGPAYPGAKALNFYASFAQEDNPNYTFSSALGDPLRAFAQGKIAYYIDYSSKAKNITLINKDLNYTVNQIPQLQETANPVNYISYETFTVPKNSKNQTLAWGLLRYLVTENNLEKYYTSTQKHPALAAPLKNEGGVVAKSAETAASWHNPDASATDKIFRQTITDVLNGTNAQTALEGAAVQVTSLLGQIKL